MSHMGSDSVIRRCRLNVRFAPNVRRVFCRRNFLHGHHNPPPQVGITDSHKRSNEPQAIWIGDELINLGYR
jgi:hypothetical protein